MCEFQFINYYLFSVIAFIAPFFIAVCDFYCFFRYPAISPEQCADGIIDGILRNQLHVIVPTHNRFAIELFRVLPYKVQHLARDILNKENEMYQISKALRNANVKS